MSKIDDGDDAEGDADDGFRLTDEQLAALELDRNIAVTAGAGTGKTTTLTERYREILESDPRVDPTNIVTITFTTDATAEMRQRIREMIDETLDAAEPGEFERWRRAKDTVPDAYIHTIHGFCSRILREYAVEAGVHPDFETLDEREAETLAREVARDVIAGALDEREDAIDAFDPGTVAADVRQLARLYDRDELVSLLAGLLEERPDSDQWAHRVLEGTEAEYVDDVIERACPIDPEEADALIAQDGVCEALRTIRALGGEEYAFTAADDAGLETIERLVALLPAGDITGGTNTDRQELFLAICDAVTTTSGSVYSDSHYYAGSATRWRKHGRESDNEELVAAFDTLIEAVDPESRTNLDIDLAAAETAAPYVFAIARLYQAVHEAYTHRKERRTAFDYADLITEAVDFLDDHDRARRELRARIDHVMVDEVQDTDPRQWELVKLLARTGDTEGELENVFLVGDEKQSIYRFRRADVTMMRRARRALSAANDEQDASEELSGNFRTVPNTLAIINDVFDRVFEPIDEDEGYREYEARPQRLSADRPKGRAVDGRVEYLVTPETDDDIPALGMDESWFADRVFESRAEREATALAARLTRLFDEPPTIYDQDAEEYRDAKPADVALLFRTTTRFDVFERVFEEYDIPYTSVGGRTFYDGPEIQPLINLLKVLSDPNWDVPLYGLLRSPVFGFTDEELAALYQPDETVTLWTQLRAADGQLGDAADRIEEWRAAAGLDGSARTTKWAALLSTIIDETGYLVAVGADERPQQAVVNVNKFRERLRTWETATVIPLPAVLRRIDRERSLDGDPGDADIPSGADGVQLRTVHSSKGLEFPIVVVPELGRGSGGGASISLDRGRFSTDLAHFEEVGDEPVLGIKAPDPSNPFKTVKTPTWLLAGEVQEREERAEEKRTLYVALTRARDHLILSSTHNVADEDTDAAFGAYDTDQDADRWRDWIQPVLLEREDRELRSDLRDNGTVSLTLEPQEGGSRGPSNGHYTVRRPTNPVDGPVSEKSDVSAHDIEIPQPSLETQPTTMSVTTVRDLLAEQDESRNRAETDADRGVRAEEGESFFRDEPISEELSSTAFGTLVHRLCELGLNGVDIERDELVHHLVDRPERLTDDVVIEARNHARIGIDRVRELEPGVEPVETYDEFQVELELSSGSVVGDIDHLTVTEDAYYITDYKTDGLDEREASDLADHYWPQLRVYACALQSAAPKSEVVLRLVFTDTDEVLEDRPNEHELNQYREDINRVLREN